MIVRTTREFILFMAFLAAIVMCALVMWYVNPTYQLGLMCGQNGTAGLVHTCQAAGQIVVCP